MNGPADCSTCTTWCCMKLWLPLLRDHVSNLPSFLPSFRKHVPDVYHMQITLLGAVGPKVNEMSVLTGFVFYLGRCHCAEMKTLTGMSLSLRFCISN